MADILIEAPFLSPGVHAVPEEQVEHLDEGPELWERDGKLTSIPGAIEWVPTLNGDIPFSIKSNEKVLIGPYMRSGLPRWDGDPRWEDFEVPGGE